MRTNTRLFSTVAILATLATVLPACHGQSGAGADSANALWRDPSKPIDERVRDLVSRMTLEEKIYQRKNEGHMAIPRLGVPSYDYWNECLHGVARAGVATVFPQAIGMAATWDRPLVYNEADVIATEARAKHRGYVETHNGDSAKFYGLNFWTPNINIFRDPRWGRGQETYGEDTFLTARLAVSFITGLQGNDPKYMKAMACAKHFVVHSGPESQRHVFNAFPSERDFYETYLPHFEAAVREAHVGAVMSAYNRVYGIPASCSPFLLNDLLRKQWGFQGHVVSDCGAVNDAVTPHHFVNTPEEAIALSILAGCDLTCWGSVEYTPLAISRGLITEHDLDIAVERTIKTRFILGMFDPPGLCPYDKIPASDNDTPAHDQLSLRVARESMVLLKNTGILPLDRTKYKKIAIVGMNATSGPVLLGNYNGDPSHPVSILDGIKAAAGPNVEINYEVGVSLATPAGQESAPELKQYLDKAVALAKQSDLIIYVGGLSPLLENEETPVYLDGFSNGDRTTVELPASQTVGLKALYATGKPVIFVSCSGSAVAMPWEAENLPAILQAWYPGQEGGTAVGDVLFGNYNPGGRLPVTFYRSTADLPDFTDYSMSNRTYRYFNGKPLYAFGHGLSYTKFDYQSVKCDKPGAAATDTIHISLNLANTGARDGDEVVQVYFRHLDSAVSQPNMALCGFSRVSVPKSGSVPVTIDVPLKEFRYWDVTNRQYIVEPGKYELMVGAASDDIRTRIPFQITK